MARASRDKGGELAQTKVAQEGSRRMAQAERYAIEKEGQVGKPLAESGKEIGAALERQGARETQEEQFGKQMDQRGKIEAGRQSLAKTQLDVGAAKEGVVGYKDPAIYEGPEEKKGEAPSADQAKGPPPERVEALQSEIKRGGDQTSAMGQATEAVGSKTPVAGVDASLPGGDEPIEMDRGSTFAQEPQRPTLSAAKQEEKALNRREKISQIQRNQAYAFDKAKVGEAGDADRKAAVNGMLKGIEGWRGTMNKVREGDIPPEQAAAMFADNETMKPFIESGDFNSPEFFATASRLMTNQLATMQLGFMATTGLEAPNMMGHNKLIQQFRSKEQEVRNAFMGLQASSGKEFPMDLGGAGDPTQGYEYKFDRAASERYGAVETEQGMQMGQGGIQAGNQYAGFKSPDQRDRFIRKETAKIMQLASTFQAEQNAALMASGMQEEVMAANQRAMTAEAENAELRDRIRASGAGGGEQTAEQKGLTETRELDGQQHEVQTKPDPQHLDLDAPANRPERDERSARLKQQSRPDRWQRR